MSEIKKTLFGNRQAPYQSDEETPVEADSADEDQGLEADNDDDRADERADDRAPVRRKLGDRLRRRRPGKRPKRRINLAFLPTILTLGNAVCGLAAISVAVSVDLPWADETKLFVAGVLIFAGMVFDALDGSAARMTGQESRFGAELDSLCDVITFGVAPAVIVWRLSSVFPQKLSWAIGVLFTLCVLIRLARFNVETDEGDTHDGFDGLPSPAAAGTIAAFAIAMPDVAAIATDPYYPVFFGSIARGALDASHYFVPLLAVCLAYLMTSRFQYVHVFQQIVRGHWSTHQFGQALFGIVIGFLLHWVALPIGFCYYAFGPPIRHLLRRGKQTADVD